MLEEQRKKIDSIDQQLVKLLEERMEVVCEVAKIKQQEKAVVLDQNREIVVLNRVKSSIKDPSFQDPILEIYQKILAVSRDYQQKQLVK